MSLINRAPAATRAPGTPPAGPEGPVEHATQFAGPYLEGLVSRAAPTPVVLRALREELERARSGAKVAHPELVDPDEYWRKAAWPQAAAIVKQARRSLVEIAEELESFVHSTAREFDQWIETYVAERAAARAEDPESARDAAIDEIAVRCTELHRRIEQLLFVRPARTAVAAARADLDSACHRQAEDDVKRSRDDVAAAHPELDKNAFKEMWTDTLDGRVHERDRELRTQLPYRHQELLVCAFELAHDAIDRDVCALVDELTSPILGVGEHLVRRYDELVVADPWAPTEHD